MTNRDVLNAARYREMANAILALVPTMKHSEVAGDLRLLADGYKKLAEYVDGRADPPQEDVEEPRP